MAFVAFILLLFIEAVIIFSIPKLKHFVDTKYYGYWVFNAIFTLALFWLLIGVLKIFQK